MTVKKKSLFATRVTDVAYVIRTVRTTNLNRSVHDWYLFNRSQKKLRQSTNPDGIFKCSGV